MDEIILAKDLTREELEGGGLIGTVGQLLDFIAEHNIPHDAKILVERIDDRYYAELGWRTYKKPNMDIPETVDEFTPIFGPAKYGDEKHLFLFLNY
jgi:hypothetical protein